MLRCLARGERVSEQIDCENVAEEIEAVGRTERRACESYLFQALLDDLKAQAWPQSREVPHWQSEARVARSNAAAAFTPSMRQRTNIASLYARARYAMPESIDGQPPLSVPESCLTTLDEMLSGAR